MDDVQRYINEIINESRSMLPAEDLARVLLGQYPKLGPLPKKMKILDVGCGNGRNSILCRDIGHDVYAVEVHAEIVKYLRSKIQGIEFQVGGNGSLPYSDSKFDAIISWHALYYLNSHTDSVLQNIREVWRCLRSGGYLIACIPHATNFIYKESRLIRKEERYGIEYREIQDYFNQRNGSVLACFPKVETFLRAIEVVGFKNHQVGQRTGDWFGLSYDWFTVVSTKN